MSKASLRLRGAIRIGTTRHSNERRDRAGAEPVSDVGPSSAVVGLNEHELAGRWALGAIFWI